MATPSRPSRIGSEPPKAAWSWTITVTATPIVAYITNGHQPANAIPALVADPGNPYSQSGPAPIYGDDSAA
jgi:hypothetical protein